MEDVVLLLKKDFHDKCYICGLQGLSDPGVEHLVPHKGNKELKFDWNNLFWSCRHCNTVKNQKKYEGMILDCTKEDPEKYLEFRFVYGSVEVKAKEENAVSLATAELIYEVFNLRNTGIRINASQYRVKALTKEMNKCMKAIQEYRVNPSTHNKNKLLTLLGNESAFAAFKRAYVRTLQEQYAVSDFPVW